MCKIFTRRLLHIDFLMRILNDSPILLPSDFLLDSLSINYRNFSYRVRFVFINLWFEACELNIWIQLPQDCKYWRNLLN